MTLERNGNIWLYAYMEGSHKNSIKENIVRRERNSKNDLKFENKH
jgi:hypothetical protein